MVRLGDAALLGRAMTVWATNVTKKRVNFMVVDGLVKRGKSFFYVGGRVHRSFPGKVLDLPYRNTQSSKGYKKRRVECIIARTRHRVDGSVVKYMHRSLRCSEVPTSKGSVGVLIGYLALFSEITCDLASVRFLQLNVEND